MNRIYKVIWSKVKHQYVVVSELAHRDGKRSSTATTSKATWRALAAALMLTGSLVAVPYIGYAAEGAATTAGQYIAVLVDYSNNSYTTGGWRPQTHYYEEGDTRTFEDANGVEHNYTWVNVTDDKGAEHSYWVREGYTITIKDEPRFETDNPKIPEDTYIIDSEKHDNADDEGLISSSQVLITDDAKHTTLTGNELHKIDAGMYGGAVNSGGTEVPKGFNYYINDNGKGYVDVGGASSWRDFDNFKRVYMQEDGTYNTSQYGGGITVSTEDLYVIDGSLGAFFNSDGTIYDGDVFGLNNEVLMTGYDETTKKYYSYWGTKITGSNMSMSNMTMGEHEKIVNGLQDNIYMAKGEAITEIGLGTVENGGTIDLFRRGYWNGKEYVEYDAEGNPVKTVAGGVTITSTGGTDGKDVAIQFANDKDSFMVEGGSKVVGKVGEGTAEAGATLDGLSINGVDYKLGGGKSVTSGTINADGTINLKQGENDNTGITLSGKIHDYALDDQDKTASDGKVTLTGKDRYGDATYDITIDGLVTTDTVGDVIAAKNNLAVAADDDSDDNKGNWTITDANQKDANGNPLTFTNTTLDVANSTSTPIGTSSDNVYGQNFTIADTAGNQFTIRDIASAKKLAEVDSLAVKYGTKDGEVDPTIIELMNPYTSEDHSGGTTITNVAYADINGNGSAAVNVDLLKDTVSAAKTEMAASDQHLIENQETGSNGAYTVNDKNEVNLGVGTIDKDGNVTQTDTVTIKDVASASDLGDVTQIHDDLKNKDENGNSIDTSVVDAVNNLDDKVGDGDFSDTTYAKNETGDTSVTDAIHNLDDAINSATTIAGQHSSVSGSDNIDVKPNGTNGVGGTDYKVTLKDDLTLGGKEGQGSISIKGSEGTINATGNISAGSFSTGNITINKDNSDTINGLSNKTWDANNIVYGQAATEDQLKAATEAAVQYDRNEDGSVNKESISLGYKDEKGNQHLTQIHNVAAGSAPTDAVNFSQLSAVGDLAINNYNNIQVLNGSINKLDSRIDKVGAGAAALAALHPLDFDPDDKWDFAAGYGNYRGESAVAIGAFYRPNEDTMFSVGGTVGNDDNMVNAGVSFKIGQGNSISTSRVAMAKEIKSMRDIVAKQDAQIQKLTAMVNALVGVKSEPDTTTMFPDVPENHWAYEAVAAMAKSGLVKGYPDGEFKGDRTMTRYEFAQIVYNAIQAGAEVDARLVEEFKPELEYFHIATVAKDKDGNPTIERVRAN